MPSPTRELRALFSDLGSLPRCDGSALLSHGDTAVLSGVLGPGDVRAAKERPDRATVEVSYRPRAGQSGVEDRARDDFVRSACASAVLASSHPRTVVHVSLQQLEDDGGELACCVNAACLALVDAGVAMRFLFASVTCAITDDGEIVVDPDGKECASAACVMTFVFDSVDRDILGSRIASGSCSENKFQLCLGVARAASEKVFEFYRECVKRKFSKEFA